MRATQYTSWEEQMNKKRTKIESVTSSSVDQQITKTNKGERQLRQLGKQMTRFQELMKTTLSIMTLNHSKKMHTTLLD